MASTLIEEKKRGINPERLSDQQLVFVNELAADLNFNQTRAAKKAGYANPGTQAGKLLKVPKIRTALGKVLHDRLERCRLTQEDVLEYLEAVLFFNPLDYFRPGEDGKWVIEDLSVLPREVGILIDGFKIKQTTDKDGSVETCFEVTLVSKATALSLAIRHVFGIEKHEHEHKLLLDWKGMENTGEEPPDPIKAIILEVGAKKK